jgi:uncharacterized membrane protein YedE/YeeE
MSIVIEPTTLEHAFAGGLAIGAAAGGLILVDGKIAGISGILSGATGKTSLAWQWAFLIGLLTAGLLAVLSGQAAPPALGGESVWLLIPAGLLVGFGTRLGNGCTSGHGVCGISRLSRRSLAATGVFMAMAAATVFVVRHVLAGA